MNFNQPHTFFGKVLNPTYKASPCEQFLNNGICKIEPPYLMHSQHTQAKQTCSQQAQIPYINQFCPSAKMEECPLNPPNNYETNYYPTQSNSYLHMAQKNRLSEPNHEHVDLKAFKVNLCTLSTHHNQKHCFKYHSTKDRRRDPSAYSPLKCKYFDNSGLCPKGDACPYSHNSVERLYHPEKYKTKFCNDHYNSQIGCTYGGFCCFAHSESDILINLIHLQEKDQTFFLFYFKTVWCPYNFDHNKAFCIYAHNWQDFRRNPNLYNYDSTLCSNWKSANFLCDYEAGCIQGANCSHCHGWKEQLFHPSFYKTQPCPDKFCCGYENLSSCPYYHSPGERRLPGSQVNLVEKRSNVKLHPQSNINDQKERFLSLNMFLGTQMKYYYVSFHDEPMQDTTYSLQSKSSSTIYQHKKTENPTNSGPLEKYTGSNSTCDTINDSSHWDDSLFNLLSKCKMEHLFIVLNGKIKVENLLNLKSFSLLQQIGICLEDCRALAYRCVRIKSSSSNNSSDILVNTQPYSNTSRKISF